jgi:hypothetical protein
MGTSHLQFELVMNPVQIEVFFPIPEGWGMCAACEVMIGQANLEPSPQERGLDEYPPDWQEDLQHLSSIIYTLADRYQDRVRIRIWDPRSFQGLLKSIRYGVRRYPTFVVNGKNKSAGWDTDKLEQYILAAGNISDSEL